MSVAKVFTLILLTVIFSTLRFGIVDGSNFQVSIGHLQPNDSTSLYEPHVLRMCSQDLKNKGILPSNVEFNITTLESCNKFVGVSNAAYFYHKHQSAVYFGPGCNEEMLAIGRLVSLWNIPIIAHMSGDDVLSDRSIFNTLGSVSLTSASEMARATLQLIRHNDWKQIGLVRSTVDFNRLSMHSLEYLIKNAKDVKVNKYIDIDPYMTPEQIIQSGLLDELKVKCRIIVLELGMDLYFNANFMQAIKMAEMNTHEYVYIIPWLAHYHQHYPWQANNVDKKALMSAYENTIVITAHGYDNQFIEAFKAKFAQFTDVVSSYYATIAYMSLYDALYLFGLAVRDILMETKSITSIKDGRKIWKKMTNRQFNGATGQVLMNSAAVRVPSYATYIINNGTFKIVLEFEAKLSENEKCIQDCSEHHIKEVAGAYWHSYDGSMPPDVPECGYDGSLCDHTVLMVLSGILLFLVVTIPTAFLVYRREKERILYDMTWRLPREQVRILDNTKTSSVKSDRSISKSDRSGSIVGSTASKLNNKLSASQCICNGVRLAYKKYKQTRNITFPKMDLYTLKELKLIEQENLNKFYGICFNQQNEFLVLWLLCQRGSLEDVLFNDDLKISRNFQVSFAKDCVKGLTFLHGTALQYHGCLCLQNCLVDSNWTVRLTNFNTEIIIAEKLRHNELKYEMYGDNENDVDDAEEAKESKEEKEGKVKKVAAGNNPSAMEHNLSARKKYLQLAPEIIRELITTKYLPVGSQPADIYSLGMVLYQILFKVEPFYEKSWTASKILEKIAMTNDNDTILRPTFPSSVSSEEGYNLQLLSCIEACWLELPEIRPHIKKVKSMINSNLRSKGSGSLVDQMMKMMEDYTTNLESLVKERTSMLEEAQQQADRLLKNMLPQSIAEDLKIGKPVLPKLYDCATVLFSDIRGFTRISSTSTPFEIVAFLNDMFSGFDSIIARHDAYKVETIGDAYMIVSGVPNQNGNAHVQNIADIALKMRSFVSSFKLAHKPEEIMMVRIGFHSGSVAAGVVGIAAPRYCLFGDTVNMASRMESTGVANKIQISESSKNLLTCFYPQFVTEQRGSIEIKGKGACQTFFLERKEAVVRRKN